MIARIPQLGVPLLIDLPIYATIGAQISNGFVPYRDLFDNKQPLIYLILWIVDLVAPRTAFVIRITGALVAGVAAVAMFLLLRRPFGTGRGLGAALLSGVLGASLVVEGLELNTEHLLVLTASCAVLLPLSVARRGTSPKVVVLAGILGGFAVLSKAVGALMLPAALLPLLWHSWPDRRHMARRIAFYSFGVAIPLLATALVFAPFGAIDDLWYANVTYNFHYIDLVPAGSASPLFRFPGELQVLVAGALVVAAVRLARSRGADLVSWTCLLWMLAAVIAAKQGRREFPHYYAPLIPAAVTMLWASLDVKKRFSFDARANVRPFAFAASALVVIVSAAPLGLDVVRTFGRSPLDNGRALWGGMVDLTKTQAEVGYWIAERSDPDDELFVEGTYPAPYWASGLRPASRYLYDAYVAYVHPDLYEDIAAELTADPPEWIVLYDEPTFPDYLATLQTEYDIERTVGSISVLRRSTTPGS